MEREDVTQFTPILEKSHETKVQRNRENLVRVFAFTLVIGVMSATLFNIVLPDIRAQFGLSFAQVSWVSSVYLLVYAIGSVVYGKLADMYKLKSIITFGLLLMAIGSLTGLSAQSYGMLLTGRVIQAAGAAVIPALSGIIPIRYFPPEQRGKAMGIFVSALAIGGVLGPIVSALVVSVIHWRWLFCLPLLVILALPVFSKHLDDEPVRDGKVDLIGGGLLAGMVVFLILSITYSVLDLALGFLFCLILLIWRIRATSAPFVQPALFKNVKYTEGLILAFLITGIGYAVPFLTPQMLGEVYQLSPEWIGLSLVPAALASALLGRKGGEIVDSKGSRVLFYTAAILMLLCFILVSTFVGEPPMWIAAFLILGNVGQSFMLIAVSHTIAQTLPREQAGIGTGLQSLMNFMSAAIAASLYGKMVDQGAGNVWNPLNEHEGVHVFSNIYLAASLGLVLIVIAYTMQFGRKNSHNARSTHSHMKG